MERAMSIFQQAPQYSGGNTCSNVCQGVLSGVDFGFLSWFGGNFPSDYFNSMQQFGDFPV
ncbi:hypothetical protein [Paenibacillus sp. FSL H7-0331]|uniref:hypothetical protein n=1 Tax=Paenibacillus sp. FSL H7-0331 TaxID=1920421 RepID=UPI0015C2E95E|nr:hypothetical protein [Paenibacillus sp. FSL H7-0331]